MCKATVQNARQQLLISSYFKYDGWILNTE